jgi:DNA-directed RNA polymerase specialized sigma24 family protein
MADPDVGEEPAIEAVRELALASARGYSPRSPAEDVAQDVAERWLRQDPKPVAWRGWVRTVTRNRVHDLMATGRGGRELPLDGGGDELVALGGGVFGPSAGVVARDQLRRMLGGLGLKECRVLVASLEGLSNSEIATEFGYASNAAVATVVHRAKARIREANPGTNFDLVPERMYRL